MGTMARLVPNKKRAETAISRIGAGRFASPRAGFRANCKLGPVAALGSAKCSHRRCIQLYNIRGYQRSAARVHATMVEKAQRMTSAAFVRAASAR